MVKNYAKQGRRPEIKGLGRGMVLFLAVSLTIAIMIFVASNKTLLPNNELRREPPIPTGNLFANAFVEVIGGCYWRLQPGWDHLAFCVNRTDYSVDSSLLNISGQYRFVLLWNTSTQAFDVYSTRSSRNPFTNLAPNESFFIYYTANQTNLIHTGTFFDNLTILGNRTWNAVPYPFTNETNMSTLVPLLGDFRFLLRWEPNIQSFEIFSPLSSHNVVEYIETGEGYMIYLNTDHVIEYRSSDFP